MLRRLITNMSLVLASLLFSFLIAEIALRFLSEFSKSNSVARHLTFDSKGEVREIGRETLVIARPFRGVRYTYAQNLTWWDCPPNTQKPTKSGCIEYSTGPHGFRKPEGRWKKPKNRKRILVIGDSVSFGLGVDADSIYSRVLQRSLRRIHQNIDVVNMGMSGFDAMDEAALLGRFIAKRSPDLVVWQLDLNDLVLTREFNPAVITVGVPMWLREHFRLFDWIASRLIATKQLRQIRNSYGIEKIGSIKKDRQTQGFMNAVAKAEGILADVDVPCVAFVWPNPAHFADPYPFIALIDFFAKYCTKHGIITVDILPCLDGFSREQIRIGRRDNHPNSLGHRLIASALSTTTREIFGEELGFEPIE